MKKLLACLLVLILCFSLFGCSETGTVSTSSTKSNSTATEKATEATNIETESTEETMATEETSATVSATEMTTVTEATEAVTEPANTTQETMVWIPTKGGTKYHAKETCSGMDGPKQVTKTQATNEGFTACKKCYK